MSVLPTHYLLLSKVVSRNLVWLKCATPRHERENSSYTTQSRRSDVSSDYKTCIVKSLEATYSPLRLRFDAPADPNVNGRARHTTICESFVKVLHR